MYNFFSKQVQIISLFDHESDYTAWADLTGIITKHMSPQTIKILNQMNHEFYSQNARNFSDTRNRAWAGWHKLLPHFDKKPLKMLDIGCGNGRFEKFLIDQKILVDTYIGVDASFELLEHARRNEHGGHSHIYIQADLVSIEHWALPADGFDAISLFAVLHHLPSFQLRVKVLKFAAKQLKPGGKALVSLWHYEKDPRFNKKIIPWSEIADSEPLDLDEGDFLVSWKNDSSLVRYVHIFSQIETENLVASSGLTLVDDFFSDGRNDALNHYLVLEKSR